MKNLKISTKLLLGFGSVLLVLIVLGLSAFISVIKLNNVVNEFEHKSMPNTSTIWQMRRNLVSVQRYTLLMIANTDPKLIDEAIKKCDEDRQKVNDNLSYLKENLGIDTSNLNDIENKLNEIGQFRTQIYQLSRENTDESNAKALEIFETKYVPMFDEMANILIGVTDDYNTYTAERSNAANETALLAEIVVGVTFVMAVIVAVLMILLMIRSVSKPISQIGKAALSIAQGNFSVNLPVGGKDEIGELIMAFGKLRGTITLLVEKIGLMSMQMQQGDIDARIPESEFDGEYRVVAEKINTNVDSLIKDTLKMLDGFDKIGRGEFKTELPKFPGKKAIANQMFDSLKQNMVSMNRDIAGLIKAADSGKLDAHIDSSLYQGDWRQLIDGLNDLLKTISLPINEANNALEQLSNGNFNISVRNDFKGSFAQMMKSFDRMIGSTASYIAEISDILGSIANGDLRKGISREYVGQFDIIKQAINNIGKTLRTTVTEIKSSAENVLSGAKQISMSSMDLANGASEQASSIEQLNASITTIDEQIQKTAKDAQTANKISQKSMESAREGNEEMSKMLVSMDEIKHASDRISKIIKVIDDIAFQTNLLALNAAVEAARAGEHGKGFSVVAAEVRALAGKSLNAAKDTAELIEDTINKIGEGTDNAQLTAQSLKKIVSDINSVSETINSIYLATNEQSEGIAQITIGVQQISEVVQNNSSTSEEAAAAAQELNSQSEVLAEMVSQFMV